MPGSIPAYNKTTPMPSIWGNAALAAGLRFNTAEAPSTSRMDTTKRPRKL